MPAINLKDFFCRYTTDKFIDVSEKGPEELRTDKRYEATQSIRITYAPWALYTTSRLYPNFPLILSYFQTNGKRAAFLLPK